MKAKRIIGHRKWQTLCLYGGSGVGKTTLIAGAPKPMFLDSNKGTLSIANIKGLEYVRSVDINGMADLDAAYDNFAGTGDEDWGGKFLTANWDHFDDMQNIILEELVEKGIERDKRREDTVELREYGIMFNKLSRLLRKFKRLPCHKILVCGEKERDDGTIVPSLVGQMLRALPYYVDHTIYMRRSDKKDKKTKEYIRYLHLNPTEIFYAKTRARWLTPEQRKIRVDFDNVHQMADIFALLAGPKKSKRAKRDR